MENIIGILLGLSILTGIIFIIQDIINRKHSREIKQLKEEQDRQTIRIDNYIARIRRSEAYTDVYHDRVSTLGERLNELSNIVTISKPKERCTVRGIFSNVPLGVPYRMTNEPKPKCTVCEKKWKEAEIKSKEMGAAIADIPANIF